MKPDFRFEMQITRKYSYTRLILCYSVVEKLFALPLSAAGHLSVPDHIVTPILVNVTLWASRESHHHSLN